MQLLYIEIYKRGHYIAGSVAHYKLWSMVRLSDKPPSSETHYPPPRDELGSCVGLSPDNLHQYIARRGRTNNIMEL